MLRVAFLQRYAPAGLQINSRSSAALEANVRLKRSPFLASQSCDWAAVAHESSESIEEAFVDLDDLYRPSRNTNSVLLQKIAQIRPVDEVNWRRAIACSFPPRLR